MEVGREGDDGVGEVGGVGEGGRSASYGSGVYVGRGLVTPSTEKGRVARVNEIKG